MQKTIQRLFVYICLVSLNLCIHAQPDVTEHEKVVRSLIRSLRQGKIPLKIEVVIALGELRPASKEVLQALQESLSCGDRALQTKIFWAFSQIGPAAVPTLLELLESPRKDLRLDACLALGRIKSSQTSVVEKLCNILDLKDSALKSSAAWALGNIAPRNPDVVRSLLKASENNDIQLHKDIALALSRMDSSFIPLLCKDLKNSNPYRRITVAVAVTKMGQAGKVALPQIKKLLYAQEIFVRAMTANALRNMGPDAQVVVPDLIKLLADQNHYVFKEAVLTLAEIGIGATEALARALNSPQSQVRYGAAIALSQMCPGAAEEAIPALMKAIKNHEISVQKYALLTLGNLGYRARPAAPLLIAKLQDPKNEIRTGAAWALLQMYPPGSGATAPDLLTKSLKSIYEHETDPTARRIIKELLKRVIP